MSPWRGGAGAQVADGRSSQANAATSRCLRDRHSTDKTTQSHIRQSFDCKRNPAAQGLGSGLLRRCCHLLVNWWNCSPGNRSRRKGGRGQEVGRKTLSYPVSRIPPLQPPTQTLISQSCFTTLQESRSANDTHVRTHLNKSHGSDMFWQHNMDMRRYEGEGKAWGAEWQAGRQASPTEHRWWRWGEFSVRRLRG